MLEWLPYYGTYRNDHTTRAGSHILMTLTELGSQLLSPANERKTKWPTRSNSRQDKVLIFRLLLLTCYALDWRIEFDKRIFLLSSGK